MAGRSGKQKEQDKSCDLSWLFFHFLFVSAEGVGGSAAEGFFLNDQFSPRHFEDFECAGETHFVFEACVSQSVLVKLSCLRDAL